MFLAEQKLLKMPVYFQKSGKRLIEEWSANPSAKKSSIFFQIYKSLQLYGSFQNCFHAGSPIFNCHFNFTQELKSSVGVELN